MIVPAAPSAPLPLFGSDAGGPPPPLVLSYGMGVDSTAVLIGWRRLGRRPDLIMFADVGSEHDSTYRYRPCRNPRAKSAVLEISQFQCLAAEPRYNILI
jgi:hypothetical protein